MPRRIQQVTKLYTGGQLDGASDEQRLSKWTGILHRPKEMLLLAGLAGASGLQFLPLDIKTSTVHSLLHLFLMQHPEVPSRPQKSEFL